MSQRNANRLLIVLAMLLLVSSRTYAQAAPTVVYTLPAGATAVQGQQWQPLFFVNNTLTPLVAAWSCQAVGTGGVVECQFVMPNVSTFLTPTGPQTFEVALRDPVVGDSGRSGPFIRTKPGAPSSGRFVLAP